MSNSQNALGDELSPYLQQHANNPVAWFPWREEALKKAKQENKLCIISIGYSSCHWCHVMERESFETDEVAAVMNQHFVSIKVDREERPDIDKLYMDAVQLMNQQGGWPLNCVTLPDGTPIFGGTYFKKSDWISILQKLAQLWEKEPNQVIDYAGKVKAALNTIGNLPGISPQNAGWSIAELKTGIENFLTQTDPINGGSNRAPKFPMPVLYNMLLHFGHHTKHAGVLNHIQLTLQKMVRGGIFDQIGGGFARYATDQLWKVPHFEKMLYDNAQLLGLYSEAFASFQDPEFLDTTHRIKDWLLREMRSPEGGFYSAQDADTEGEEGKYYTWPKEFTEGIDRAEFGKYYQTDPRAIWENRIIPIRINPETDWNNPALTSLNSALLALRQKRVAPLTDTKILCSWNAMLGTAFVKHHKHCGDETSLVIAVEIFDFISAHLFSFEKMTLKHSWQAGVQSQHGFSEDYAFFIEMLLELYSSTFDEKYLDMAMGLSYTAIDNFYDSERGLFFLSASDQTELISRPSELNDNVIPSANSTMAHNLSKLAAISGVSHFDDIANRMLSGIRSQFESHIDGFSHWADFALTHAIGAPEIVVCGEDFKKHSSEIQKDYFPNTLYAGSAFQSTLNILSNRYCEGETRTYICENQTCMAPFLETKFSIEAIKKLKHRIESAS